MNPVTVALAAGALIIAGKWSRGQTPNMENAIGVAGIALGLSILDQMNQQFSKAFGVLILISVAIVYLPDITKGAGLAKK